MDFASQRTGQNQNYYQLETPIAVSSSCNNKIRITLRLLDGVENFVNRTVAEGSYARMFDSAEMVGKSVATTNHNTVASITDTMPAGVDRFPHGQLALGVCLQGIEVQSHVCDQFQELMDAGSTPAEKAAILTQALGGACSFGK